MDPQSMAQKAHDIEAIRQSIAADVASAETVFIIMACLVVCWAVFMIVALWYKAQRDSAERRVRDRLDQEEDPEAGPDVRLARPVKPRSLPRN